LDETFYPTSCRYDPEGGVSHPCPCDALWQSTDGANASKFINGWRFVTAPGTDELLMARYALGGARRTLYFVMDGRGRQLAVGDSVGYLTENDQGNSDPGSWQYAGATQNGAGFDATRLGNTNLPGVSYFRNRAYDSRTGRWLQEDPIGVAGGLNLYQFNGNNPVAYTDPFGLCPPWPDCVAQGIANWGARQGGVAGSLALNAGAALSAGLEAFGINDAARGGEALGRGELKASAGFLALAFGGEVLKGAKLLKNVAAGAATADEVLKGAERWLGAGYREIDNGVFRSADGARQFRMTASDLAHKSPHVHFESIGPDGKKITQNAHVDLTDQ